MFESNEYKVFWHGLIFMNGSPSGIESIKAFIAELKNKKLEEACGALKGIYFLSIESKKNGSLFAFVDNSGLYHAYHTYDTVSNSFLDLAINNKYTSTGFNPAAVAEFLNFGYLISPFTYFQSIRRIERNDILFVPSPGGEITIKRKKNKDYTEQQEIRPEQFEQYFYGLTQSLNNCKTSLDLTGGVDSRLIAAMLDRFGLEFETATSGGAPDYPDVAISKKVSKALGHPWFCTLHSASGFIDDAADMLLTTDGLFDLLYYHRLYQLQKDRKMRGIDTLISGVGGEIFKDYWWLHDFPFYKKKKADIEKFIHLRIMPNSPIDKLLTHDFAKASRSLRKTLVDLFSRYILETNTRTYDNIFFNLIMSNMAGRILTSHCRHLKCHAPYLDPEIFKIGFNLPRRMRLYNLFHRKELTRTNPVIARLETTENGISASYRISNMALDAPKYLQEKTQRALIKLRLRNKPNSQLINDSSFYSEIRNSEILRDSLDTLKKAGILHKETEPDQLDEKHLGAFITLGLVTLKLNFPA